MKKSSFVQALIHNHYVGTGKKKCFGSVSYSCVVEF